LLSDWVNFQYNTDTDTDTMNCRGTWNHIRLFHIIRFCQYHFLFLTIFLAGYYIILTLLNIISILYVFVNKMSQKQVTYYHIFLSDRTQIIQVRRDYLVNRYTSTHNRNIKIKQNKITRNSTNKFEYTNEEY
jgi:hypothetical protein